VDHSFIEVYFMSKKRRERRVFDTAFKLEVVRMVKDQGLSISDVGRYRVRRLMHEAALRPVWKRKFVHTTDSKHDLPIAENLLNRQFDVAVPNQAWTSDITYVRTRQGWLYLAAVMDLFSRKIVGWAMAPS
jgi:putative transposase